MDETFRRRMWLALARVPGAVGFGIAHRLAAPTGSPAGSVMNAALEEGAPPVGNRDEAALVRAAAAEARAMLPIADAELRRAERCGARLVDFEDAEYPALLREIRDAPPAIFVRGRIEPRDERAAAFIGSRAATRYGLAVTRQIVPGVVGRGVTIVSGMARGIDAAAHRAALRAGGRTIAVLGTGIDVCYPRDSRDLYEEIPACGAVLSEVAPGTGPAPWVFPPRNRILSGVSKAVVIVEARVRSGTALTARHALDQGREVGVVPGDIDLARSAGTNALLVEGAFAVRGADDVLAFGFGEARREEAPSAGRAPDAPPPGLDEDSARAWSAIARGESTLEAVVVATGSRPLVVMAAVGKLQRAGLIAVDDWGRYLLGGGAEARR